MWITDAGELRWGIVFARTGEQGQRGGDHLLHRRQRHAGHQLQAHSGDPLLFALRDPFRQLPRSRWRTGSARKGRASRSRRNGWSRGACPYAAERHRHRRRRRSRWRSTGRKQRETFGSKLSQKQAIQWMIADSEMELRAARLLVYQAAWAGDLGRDLKIESSIAKVCRDRNRRARGGPLRSRFRRPRRVAGDAAGALVPRAPDQAHRRGAVGGAAHGGGAPPARRGGADMSIDFEVDATASPPSRSTVPSGCNAMDAEHYAALSAAWARVRDDAEMRVRHRHRRGRHFLQRRRRSQVVGRAAELS